MTKLLFFFNKTMSNFLLPVISIHTKINTVNDTLIDNIFTNEFHPDLISGNFTEDISDIILDYSYKEQD